MAFPVFPVSQDTCSYGRSCWRCPCRMPDARPLCQTLCQTLDRGARFQKSPGKDAKSHHRVSSNFKVNIYGQPLPLSMHSQGLGNVDSTGLFSCRLQRGFQMDYWKWLNSCCGHWSSQKYPVNTNLHHITHQNMPLKTLRSNNSAYGVYRELMTSCSLWALTRASSY